MMKVAGTDWSLNAKAPPRLKTNRDRIRILAACVPAALVTGGLFAVMTGLIQVREIRLEDGEARTLEPIVYDRDPPSDVITRVRFPQPVEAVTPPPPPRVSTGPKDISFRPVVLAGTPPERVPASAVLMPTAPQPVIDRPATPIRPPMPRYPRAAAAAGLEGDCEVRFDITPRGSAYNVVASCTHRVFESEARRSVETAEFLPGIVDGRAVETRGAVYPVTFRFNSE